MTSTRTLLLIVPIIIASSWAVDVVQREDGSGSVDHNDAIVSTPPTADRLQPEDSLLQNIKAELRSLKAELNREKWLRHELQNLTITNIEDFRRFHRSYLVANRDTRDKFRQMSIEQTRLEEMIARSTSASEDTQPLLNVTQLIELNEEIETAKQRLTELESALSGLGHGNEFYHRGGTQFDVTNNVTRAISALQNRIAVEESQSARFTRVIDEINLSFKARLRRKLRELRSDFELRIRDYNVAMSTMAADMTHLRREVEQNINNINDNLSIDGKSVGNYVSEYQSQTNISLEKISQEIYYIARAQLDQVDAHQTLRQEFDDLYGAHHRLREEAERLTERLRDVTEQWTQRERGLVELQLRVLCPYPYMKFGSSCYTLLEETLTWPYARRGCEELAASVGSTGGLATAAQDTESLRSYVRNFVRNYATVNNVVGGAAYVWVGGFRSTNTQTWEWLGGRPVNQTLFPWAVREPDLSADQSYMCVKVSGQAMFHNCLDGSQLYAVCELQIEPFNGRSITLAEVNEDDAADDQQRQARLRVDLYP